MSLFEYFRAWRDPLLNALLRASERAVGGSMINHHAKQSHLTFSCSCRPMERLVEWWSIVAKSECDLDLNHNQQNVKQQPRTCDSSLDLRSLIRYSLID